jgi:hypothetical protein
MTQHHGPNHRYANGFKYCERCAQYIKTEALRCPVCNRKLRRGSRRTKWRKEDG